MLRNLGLAVGFDVLDGQSMRERGKQKEDKI